MATSAVSNQRVIIEAYFNKVIHEMPNVYFVETVGWL